MRDHGVSGFPDPSTTETPNSFGIDGYNFDLPSTMNTQSPADKSADQTCQRVLGSGNGTSQASGGAGINPRSPAFQQAQKLCGGG